MQDSNRFYDETSSTVLCVIVIAIISFVVGNCYERWCRGEISFGATESSRVFEPRPDPISGRDQPENPEITEEQRNNRD